MKPITERFTAWRRQPKVPAVVPPPKTRAAYPHSGFLNAQETHKARQIRLEEALINGYYLTCDDWAWLKNARITPWKGDTRARDRRQLRAIDYEYRNQLRGTVPLYSGGSCSSR